MAGGGWPIALIASPGFTPECGHIECSGVVNNLSTQISTVKQVINLLSIYSQMNALSNGIKHYLKIIDAEKRQGGDGNPSPLTTDITKSLLNGRLTDRLLHQT
jgi:hypothetical protein